MVQDINKLAKNGNKGSSVDAGLGSEISLRHNGLAERIVARATSPARGTANGLIGAPPLADYVVSKSGWSDAISKRSDAIVQRAGRFGLLSGSSWRPSEMIWFKRGRRSLSRSIEEDFQPSGVESDGGDYVSAGMSQLGAESEKRTGFSSVSDKGYAPDPAGPNVTSEPIGRKNAIARRSLVAKPLEFIAAQKKRLQRIATTESQPGVPGGSTLPSVFLKPELAMPLSTAGVIRRFAGAGIDDAAVLGEREKGPLALGKVAVPSFSAAHASNEGVIARASYEGSSPVQQRYPDVRAQSAPVSGTANIQFLPESAIRAKSLGGEIASRGSFHGVISRQMETRVSMAKPVGAHVQPALQRVLRKSSTAIARPLGFAETQQSPVRRSISSNEEAAVGQFREGSVQADESSIRRRPESIITAPDRVASSVASPAIGVSDFASPVAEGFAAGISRKYQPSEAAQFLPLGKDLPAVQRVAKWQPPHAGKEMVSAKGVSEGSSDAVSGIDKLEKSTLRSPVDKGLSMVQRLAKGHEPGVGDELNPGKAAGEISAGDVGGLRKQETAVGQTSTSVGLPIAKPTAMMKGHPAEADAVSTPKKGEGLTDATVQKYQWGKTVFRPSSADPIRMIQRSPEQREGSATGPGMRAAFSSETGGVFGDAPGLPAMDLSLKGGMSLPVVPHRSVGDTISRKVVDGRSGDQTAAAFTPVQRVFPDTGRSGEGWDVMQRSVDISSINSLSRAVQPRFDSYDRELTGSTGGSSGDGPSYDISLARADLPETENIGSEVVQRSASDGTGGGPDSEAIAREVYAIIKRRLVVEKERAGVR